MSGGCSPDDKLLFDIMFGFALIGVYSIFIAWSNYRKENAKKRRSEIYLSAEERHALDLAEYVVRRDNLRFPCL